MIAILVLAVIQGVAEFLPISSSAHLVIFRDLFGVGKNLITNDISLIFEYCDFNLYEIIKNHKRNQTPIPESKIKNICL